MGNYNPNTTPVWLSLMPTILGILAVAMVIGGLVYGAHLINSELENIKNLTGQVIGC